MAHGQQQAIFGLGKGENSVTDPVNNDAEAIIELELGEGAGIAAANISVDSTSLAGTATVLQTALVEIENVADDHIALGTAAHAASAISASSSTLVGVGTTVQAVFEELDDAIAVLETYKPLYSTLTANSAARNASVVLLDSGLAVTTPIAGTYHLEALVSVTTSANADVSLKFDGTAVVTATVGTSDIFYIAGPQVGGTGAVGTQTKILPTSWTTEVETMFANTGASVDHPFMFYGTLVVTTAGTIKIQFAQGTSDVSDTKIQAGSYLKLQRVA